MELFSFSKIYFNGKQEKDLEEKRGEGLGERQKQGGGRGHVTGHSGRPSTIGGAPGNPSLGALGTHHQEDEGHPSSGALGRLTEGLHIY